MKVIYLAQLEYTLNNKRHTKSLAAFKEERAASFFIKELKESANVQYGEDEQYHLQTLPYLDGKE